MSESIHGPNAEQATYWSETSGPKWVALQERIDAQISPIGLAGIEHAAPRPGERCLDVGCGCGQTSLQIAQRVAPAGRVHGVDLSIPMLERARGRAAEHDLPIHFERADAQTRSFEPGLFDLVFSRFGIMFFQDPVAAFRNLHTAAAPAGRLVFVCWRALAENAWVTVPLAAAAKHLPLPEPGDPDAPGPFSLARPERVRQILADAGWQGIEVEPLDVEIDVGGGAPLDELVHFVLQIGPTARLLADAEPAKAVAVRDEVRAALEPRMQGGRLRLGSAAWRVSAKPGPA